MIDLYIRPRGNLPDTVQKEIVEGSISHDHGGGWTLFHIIKATHDRTYHLPYGGDVIELPKALRIDPIVVFAQSVDPVRIVFAYATGNTPDAMICGVALMVGDELLPLYIFGHPDTVDMCAFPIREFYAWWTTETRVVLDERQRRIEEKTDRSGHDDYLRRLAKFREYRARSIMLPLSLTTEPTFVPIVHPDRLAIDTDLHRQFSDNMQAILRDIVSRWQLPDLVQARTLEPSPLVPSLLNNKTLQVYREQVRKKEVEFLALKSRLDDAQRHYEQLEKNRGELIGV
jgi:hypothetical protein